MTRRRREESPPHPAISRAARQAAIDVDRRARIAACLKLGIHPTEAIGDPNNTGRKTYEGQVAQICALEAEEKKELTSKDLNFFDATARNYIDHYTGDAAK